VRTLAALVIAFLSLYNLGVWQLHSIIRAPLIQAAPTPRDREAAPTEMPEVAKTATFTRPEHHAQARPSPPATSAPSTDRLAPPTPTTTSAPVRWADDDQRAAKRRFAELRESLIADPHNPGALRAALQLARQLEWHNEACDLLARLVRLRPEDVELRFELATQLMRLERWLEAIPQLRSVVEAQPENARAWYNLAVAHQALGHLRDARATWNRVIELMPENPDAYAHRGEILLDLHACEQAAADFEASLRLEPGSLDTTMNLALVLTRLGRPEEARRRLLPLLARHPAHAPLLNRLAEVSWTLYEMDPTAYRSLARETAEYCARSLAINDNQPDIKTLRERAARATD
jgi:predicted Zn-dependent protease